MVFSPSIIARISDYNNKHFTYFEESGSWTESRRYQVIGQAFLCPNNGDTVFSWLEWSLFLPRWRAEDLLLLYWTFVHRPFGDQLRTTIYHWLSLKICSSKHSSDVYGPVPPSEMD